MRISIQEQTVLAPYTTLQVGGPARFFVEVASVDELREAYQFARENNLSITVLGGGSNVLVPDAGVDGLVVRMAITGVEWGEDENGMIEVVIGAGEEWDELVSTAVEQGAYGVENLSGIPGSVGAAPVQNIGAYGVELADVFGRLEAFDITSGEIVYFKAEDCGFAYRDSIFKHETGCAYVITRVALTLSTLPSVNIGYKDLAEYFADRAPSDVSPAEVRGAVLDVRSKKFPNWHIHGTAGSFFKNPIVDRATAESITEQYPEVPCYELEDGTRKLSAAWILDHICGLRGYQNGNVELYQQQPLVLVNTGEASASEIEEFALFVQNTVYTATGITLEREVRTLE